MTNKCQCHFCSSWFCKKSYQTGKIAFCNRSCLNLYNKSKSSAINKNCNECNKLIAVKNNQRRKSKTGLHFCCNLCKNRYISKHSQRNENPYDNRARRKKLFEAANNECQNCGKVDDPKMLDIHHNNGNHHDNAWTNLRSVCVWCHQMHHRCGVVLNLPELFDKEGNRV